MDSKGCGILMIIAETPSTFDEWYNRQGIKDLVDFSSYVTHLMSACYVIPDKNNVYHITSIGQASLEVEKIRRKTAVVAPVVTQSLMPTFNHDSEFGIKPLMKPTFTVRRDRYGNPQFIPVKEEIQ